MCEIVIITCCIKKIKKILCRYKKYICQGHKVSVFKFEHKGVIGPVLIKGNKKGTYTLLYKNFLYTRSTKSKKGIVWKCTAKKTEDCKASITTDDNLSVVVSKGEHSHKHPDLDTKPKHVYFTTTQ